VANKSLRQQDCLLAAENGRGRVTHALKTLEDWNKEVKKAENEIHIAIIRKYIDEAGHWLYAVKEEMPEKEEITPEQVNADLNADLEDFPQKDTFQAEDPNTEETEQS